MSFIWKIPLAVLGLSALVFGVCVANLKCCGKPGPDTTVGRIQGELAAGKREYRSQQANELARMAHELRILAQGYKAKGENKKALRAVSAARELDKKIQQLLENDKQEEGK